MSEDVKTAVAESSPSAPVVYDSWDDKGNPIVSKREEVTPTKQDSAPAKAEKPSERAAPDTAKEPSEKPHRGKSDAAGRLEEILADLKNAGLSPAELKTFKREAQKVETKAESSSAAAKADPKPQVSDLKEPVEPNIDDYDGSDGKTIKDYNKAMAKYARDYAEFLTEKRERERTMRETVMSGLRQLQSEIEEAAKHYDNFTVKAIDDAAGTIYKDADVNVLVKQAFMESDVLVHLLHTLTTEDGGVDSFVKEAKLSPTKAMKKIAVLEQLIREELKNGTRGKGKAKAEAKEDAGEGDDTESGKETAGKGKEGSSPDKEKPRAPKPPSEVGGRGTSLEDASVAAAKANDFAAFERAENAKLKTRSR